MEELINKQKQYIEFLERELTSLTPLCTIHGWECPKEVIIEGIMLREEIKILEERL